MKLLVLLAVAVIPEAVTIAATSLAPAPGTPSAQCAGRSLVAATVHIANIGT